MDNLSVRNQGANNFGVAPNHIDDMMGINVPSDFEFEAVFGDMVMARVADEDEDGNVLRGGVWVSQDVTKKIWRKAQVVLVGPDCQGVKVGDYIAYPNDRGIAMITAGKEKMIFLDERRIFGKLKS